MNPMRKLKVIFQAATQDTEFSPTFEKFDETTSPNMRALRLSITIADVLISMGVSVADVVSMSLDITDRYCHRKVQFDISSTLITASQDRGNDREPLTVLRHATPRTTNNTTIQSIQELVRDIQHGKHELHVAEEILDSILVNPKHYPRWITVSGGGFISAGVGILLGASPIIISIMLIVGMIVSYILRYLGHKRVPSFFAQIISAMSITLIAAFVAWLGTSGNVVWLSNVNPTYIIIGGIVMLVAGIAIVGAVQDAIDEFYVTANARLLKAVMMTVGIVAGVLTGLYIAKQAGISIFVSPDLQPVESAIQILGAVLISAGYALSMQTRPLSILAAAGIGALGWNIYQLSLTIGDSALTPIVATALAATVVGAVATLISRVWRTPSTALMMAGIVPLVPGLTLYNGLFLLIGNSENSYNFDQGVVTLLSASLIALAIASGVSLGHLVARPVRRTLVRARNAIPMPRPRIARAYSEES